MGDNKCLAKQITRSRGSTSYNDYRYHSSSAAEVYRDKGLFLATDVIKMGREYKDPIGPISDSSVIKRSQYVDIKVGNNDFKLDSNLDSIAREIENSKYILELKDDWDDNGAVQPNVEKYIEAIHFLTLYSNFIFNEYDAAIAPPEINPGRNGAIDLDWRAKGAELLIAFQNINETCIHYYGDNGNNNLSIEGILGEISINEDLAHWMRKLTIPKS